jgi:hypothetical protein
MNLMPVRLCAEIMADVRLSPQFVIRAAFARYRFAKGARFALEFPILGFLLDRDDTLCGGFGNTDLGQATF